MKLNREWKAVLRKAWSIRGMALAGLLTGCEAVIQAYGVGWVPLPTWARLAVILVVIGGAFVARIVAQQGLDDDK